MDSVLSAILCSTVHRNGFFPWLSAIWNGSWTDGPALLVQSFVVSESDSAARADERDL